MSKSGSQIHTPDYHLIIGFIILLVFGFLMLTSASHFVGCQKQNDCYFYLKHQLLYGLLPGLIILFLLSHLDYRKLKKVAVPILVGVIFLLILVLLPKFGVIRGGSQRWLRIGSIVFQPSEAIKLAFLLFLSAWLSKKQTDVKNFSRVFIPFVFLIGIISALIIPQKDLSTLVIIISSALVVYFLAGTPVLHLGYLFLGFFLVVGIAVKYEPYRLQRLLVFSRVSDVDVTGIGYHVAQAFSAISSGGIFGRGLGLSAQKISRLPEVISDSIFAVTAEELGFMVTALLVIVYFFVAYRIFKIAFSSKDKFGQLLAGGIGFWFIFQASVNMGGMMGLLPITGIPLPFMSYGSSSLVVFLAAFGILINISKQTKICLN